MDFMRGEEIQCFGVLRNYPEIRPPFTIIVLSSHTKYIHMDAQERIAGSITTLSGQIYEALISSTSIGKSIHTDSSTHSGDAVQDSLEAAAAVVRNAGFLRALLMPRFMEVLLDTTPEQRKLFIESAIIAEDLTAFKDYQHLFGTSGQPVIVFGDPGRSKIFQRMATILEIEVPDFTAITGETEIDDLHIKGALEIAARIKHCR
jgi:2-dehydro-3-deoxygalactonokinase